MSDYTCTGYHGTLKNRVNSIINNNFSILPPTHKKPDHWLGNGIYFFQYSFHAKQWAILKANAKNKKEYTRRHRPALLQADFSANTASILDLDDPEQLKLMSIRLKDILADLTSHDYTFESSELTVKQLDSFLMDLYKETFDVAIIIYTFLSNTLTLPLGEIDYLSLKYNQKQICVTTNKYIHKDSIKEIIIEDRRY